MRAAHAVTTVQVIRPRRSAAPARPRATLVRTTRKPVIRAASVEDVEAIHQLIEQHVAEGRLLPRRAVGWAECTKDPLNVRSAKWRAVRVLP